MENILQKHIGKLIVLGALMIMLATYLVMNKPVALGSALVGNDYQATTTRAVTGVALPSYFVLKSAGGSLGSIIITGANTGVINIYDSTTTGMHSLYATTSVAMIPASAAAGTYTFDVDIQRGIVFELGTGLMPTTTITYR